MDLILWRHAQAEDGPPDLERRLTARGREDAKRVGAWLRERLPSVGARVLSSPAVRARQTADALGLRYDVIDALAPGAEAADAIAASGWADDRDATVIVVGHNPWIGEAVSRLVGGCDDGWAIRKAGLWWLSRREHDVLVRAVMSPELLRQLDFQITAGIFAKQFAPTGQVRVLATLEPTRWADFPDVPTMGHRGE